MKNIIKAILIQLLAGSLFALHGKIVFYDGTYVVGKITKVDESSVYIVPVGLDSSEGVLVGNIDSLKMENGMIPVVNSAVKYFYQNGEFLANDDDWMDEYNDFEYDDYALIEQEYKYESSKKTPQQYYQVSGSLGLPVVAAQSMKENETTGLKETIYSNLTGSIQLPYYAFGAVDVSPGFRMMSYGWENSYNGQWKCLQAVAFTSIDFKPVFYFLPKAVHPTIDVGLSYNFAFDSDQDTTAGGYFSETIIPGAPGQNYGGVGFSVGGSIDYWLDSLPIAIRFFGNTYFIPQAPPFPELKTMFGSVGISLVVVLKRHHKNNTTQ